jgi:hypothetical protein
MIRHNIDTIISSLQNEHTAAARQVAWKHAHEPLL